MKSEKQDFFIHQPIIYFCATLLFLWSIEFSRLGNNSTPFLQNSNLLYAIALDTLYGASILSIAVLCHFLSKKLPFNLLLSLLLTIEALLIFFFSTTDIFFQKTGSHLDLDLVMYSLRNIDHLGGLLAESAGPVALVKLFIPIFLIIPGSVIAASYLEGSERTAKVVGIGTTFLIVVALGLFISNARTIYSYKGILHSSLFSSKLLSAQQVAHGGNLMYSPRLPNTPSRSRPNIFIFVLESFRADLIKSRKPAGTEITPYLNSLDREFLYFDNNYTTVSHTSKALIGIQCGMFANLTMDITEARPHGTMRECLPQILSMQGYSTAFIQSASGRFENRKQLVSNLGYSTFVAGEHLQAKGARMIGYFNHDDALLVDEAKAILETAESPILLTALTSITHHPYHLPSENCKGASAAAAKACYLKAAGYADSYIARMMQLLKQKGLYDEALIIITGDHGEGFGEHSRFQHDEIAYQEVTRTPLWIKFPGKGAGVSNRLSQHIDIYPTVLNLIGLPFQGNLPGKDLYAPGHDYVVTFCWYNPSCMARVDATGRKSIADLRSGEVRIFDLIKDPLEKQPIQTFHFTNTPSPDMQSMVAAKLGVDQYWREMPRLQAANPRLAMP